MWDRCNTVADGRRHRDKIIGDFFMMFGIQQIRQICDPDAPVFLNPGGSGSTCCPLHHQFPFRIHDFIFTQLIEFLLGISPGTDGDVIMPPGIGMDGQPVAKDYPCQPQWEQIQSGHAKHGGMIAGRVLQIIEKSDRLILPFTPVSAYRT
jgi:hypothetical protein